jgi:hypothetical protein
LILKPEGKRPLERPSLRLETINMAFIWLRIETSGGLLRTRIPKKQKQKNAGRLE